MKVIIYLIPFLTTLLYGQVSNLAKPLLPNQSLLYQDQTDTTSNGFDKKNYRTALRWSIANSVIPFVSAPLAQALLRSDKALLLSFYGLVIGPSGGHLYTQDWKRTLVGSGIRYAGGRILLRGLFACWEPGCTKYEEKASQRRGIVGLLIYEVGIGYTLYTLTKSVETFNTRYTKRNAIAVLPILIEKPYFLTGMREYMPALNLQVGF